MDLIRRISPWVCHSYRQEAMVHQPTGIDPEIKLLKSTLFDLIQDYMKKYLALTVHWLWAAEELPSQIWSKLAHLDNVDKISMQYFQREGSKTEKSAPPPHTDFSSDWVCLPQLTTFTALGTPHWHIGSSWGYSSKHCQRQNVPFDLSFAAEVPIWKAFYAYLFLQKKPLSNVYWLTWTSVCLGVFLGGRGDGSSHHWKCSWKSQQLHLKLFLE